MLRNYPSITVIIPVKPSAVVKAVEAVSKFVYPKDKLEIIVAKGCRPSAQRNRAAKSAKGELLYFLDDDSLPVADAVKRLADHFQDSSITVVGGPSCTPGTDNLFQRSAGYVLSSLIGGGGVRNRYRSFGKLRSCRDNELILCNFCIRKEVFLEYGGLDERLYPNEENELIERLLKEKHILLHDPELIVNRSQRKNYRAFCRQMLGYGRGRGEQIRITGGLSLQSMLPVLLLIYAVILPLLPLIALTPFSVYLIAVLVSSIWISISDSIKIFPIVLILIPSVHFLYAAGILIGIISPRFLKVEKGHDIDLMFL